MLKLVWPARAAAPAAAVAATPAAGPGALAAWADAVRAGDGAAMQRLLGAVGPAMLRAIRKVLGPDARDAEDVMQEAAEGLLGALPSFRGECTLLHFACRVAVFSALAWRRRLHFQAEWLVDAPDAVAASPSAAASPAETVAAGRRRALLDALLDELPAPQAEVLVLHYALGFAIEEIAAAVGRPGETIRSRLRLAKRALRDRIGGSAEMAEILELGP